MSNRVRVLLDDPALHRRERGQRLPARQPRGGLLQRQAGACEHVADQRRDVAAAHARLAAHDFLPPPKKRLIRSHMTDQNSEPAFSGSLAGGGATLREGPPAAAVAGGGPPCTGPAGASCGPAPAASPATAGMPAGGGVSAAGAAALDAAAAASGAVPASG